MPSKVFGVWFTSAYPYTQYTVLDYQGQVGTNVKTYRTAKMRRKLRLAGPAVNISGSDVVPVSGSARFLFLNKCCKWAWTNFA